MVDVPNSIVGEHADTVIPPKYFANAIYWLIPLTSLLQQTQTELYTIMIAPHASSTIPLHQPRKRHYEPRNFSVTDFL